MSSPAELLWIPVTLGAAVFQIIRTALQKRLKDQFDDLSVTWIRYGYGLPFVWAYAGLFATQAIEGHSLDIRFLALCLTGGITQIFGTILLIGMFSHRNFAVSTTFAKTEGVQIALLGILFVSEPLSLPGWLGVLVGTCGVVTMSVARSQLQPRDWLSSLFSRTACMGIISGTCFAATALAIRNGYETLDASDGVAGNLGVFHGSAIILCVMVTMQTVALGLWIAARKPSAFGRMFRASRMPLAVGVTSFAGSALWFSAFSLAHPAYVKTLANIELPLAIIVGARFFKERHTFMEYIGIVLTMLGVTAVLYA